jgi:hypothetical protein
MAIYDDDFQSYTLGTGAPFGSWILDPSAITNAIVSGSGPTGTTQSYRVLGTVAVDPTVTSFQTSFSEFFSLRKLGDGLHSGAFAAFANGPNGTGHTFTLVALQVEKDGTISVVGPDSTVIANSIDDWFEYNVVNFIQVNVQVSDVLVLGVLMINVNVQVGLNGRQVLSINHTSNTPVAQLVHATSEVNRFQLLSTDGFYGAFTLDSLQSMVSYPHLGTPQALAQQAVAEVDVLPDTATLEVHQAVLEVDCLIAQGIRPEYIHRRHLPGD